MPKFQDALIEQGAGAVGSVVGAGMGLLLGGINDRRQLKQQGRLNEQQWKIDQRAIDYNYEKQLEMWERTGYGGQMKQLKEAGLNPGLIYGMGGAGGATTGSGGGGGVHGTAAPTGGGEIMGMMQLRNMEAQNALLKAQAKKTDVEADKLAGVDTEEAKTRIAAGLQGIEESKSRINVQKLDAKLKEIEAAYQGRTLEDRIELLDYDVKIAFTELELIRNQAFVSRNTMNEQVTLIKNQVVQSIANILNTRASTANLKADTALKGEQRQLTMELAQKAVNDVMQGWDSLSNENKMVRLDEMMKTYHTDVSREVKNDLINIIDAIYDGGKGRTPIEGFSPKRKY